MTFDAIVSEIAARINITSSEGTTRIGRLVNQRHRRITSSLGLLSSRRTTVSAVTVSGTQTVVFTGIEKIITVSQRTGTVDRFLQELSVEELKGALDGAPSIPSDSLPPSYAINRMNATTVEVLLGSIPNSIFTLYATGHINAATLATTNEPLFSESFHDAIMYGVLADEYKKMEKKDLADSSKEEYDERMSDLRMWILKSTMQDVFQGKTRGGGRDISRGIQ